MSSKIPAYGDFTIDSTLIDEHEWVSDAFIDSLGKTCTLIYPSKQTECPNCYLDPFTQRSTNRYRSGGPMSFTDDTLCPWCHGEGHGNVEVTENITVRVYWRQADWTKFVTDVSVLQNPEGTAMIIGYMTDLPKLERANELIIPIEQQGMREWRCVRNGEAQPWGFRNNRYFIQFVRRQGGG